MDIRQSLGFSMMLSGSSDTFHISLIDRDCYSWKTYRYSPNSLVSIIFIGQINWNDDIDHLTFLDALISRIDPKTSYSDWALALYSEGIYFHRF